ncbi:MAG: tetratricopeptide repeat protein [Ignavibacteriales bacterium]|nr:MAG: tetratricopeptide repeat protein [Ignavibacteriales bacterium]
MRSERYRLVYLLLVLLLAPAGTILPQGYDDSGNRFMLAQSYEQAGDFARARMIYEELYAKQPANQQFIMALHRVYTQLKEHDKAVQILEKAVRQIPRDMNLYSLLGKSYYAQGRESAADSLWRSYISFNPGDPVAYKVFSNTALELRDFEFALSILRFGKENTKNIKAFAFDLGYLYSITMQFEQAAEEYAGLLAVSPEQYFAVQSRVLTYIRKPDAAESTLRVLSRPEYSASREVMRLLAEIYTETGETGKAFDLYKELDRSQSRNGEDIYSFGMRLYNDKLYKVSADVFSYLLESYPKAPQMPQWRVSYVRSLEGTVYQQSEAPENRWIPYPRLSDDAKSKYQKVAELYKEIISVYPYAEISVEARIRLGAVYQELGMYDESLRYYSVVINDFPMYPGARAAYRGKAEVHLRRGELQEAENILLKANGQPGLAPHELSSLNFLLAKLKFYQGDFPASSELLAGITRSGSDNTANDALELSMMINGAMKDSLALLEFSRAEQLLAGGKFEEAEQRYNLMHLNEKFPFLLRHTSQVRIAHIAVSAGRFNEAKGFIDSILAKEKNIFADKLMFLLGNMLEYGIKDTPAAVSVYEDFLSKFPKSIFTEEVREKLVRLRNKSSS